MLATLPVIADASVIYCTDFDADDGGWVATSDWDPAGDWAWTADYDVGDYTGGHNPPPAAYSGTGLWGTVIDGDYTNAEGSSWLSQTFDLTGITDLELEFASWAEIDYPTDTATLYINGDVVYERTTSDVPSDWDFVTIDMSAYDGMASVEIMFELYASAADGRAGWYVDDICITGIPAPATLAVLGLAGLARRRRR